MRKELKDLSDMMKSEELHDDEADFERLKKAVEKRHKLEYFDRRIRNYLRKNKIWIHELDKRWLDEMMEWLTERDQKLFIDQVIWALKINFWKSLQRIKDNHKSVLLDQIK